MVTLDVTDVRARARQHLFPHFTRGTVWRDEDLPVIVRGQGCHLYDDRGRRWLDGLAGLFCVNLGHGRQDIPATAFKQMGQLAYWTNWGAAHPAAVEAATLIAELAPGDLEKVFFVNSGSEAVESAIKFARQYHRSQGQPQRTKIISREMSYHGTTLGALAVTGIPKFKAPFGPLMPGVRHVPHTLGEVVPEGGSAADLPSVRRIVEVIEEEGPETVAAIFAEPVQNSRGALVPPRGYWQELRSICDRYGILLVADEVITGFGRTGQWFGSTRYEVVPDLLTFAKGSTSGYAPMGGVLVRAALGEALLDSPQAGMFTHGATWGGHPVSTAVAAANISAMRDEGVLDHVRRMEPPFQAGLDEIVAGHDCVKEWRGTGYFYALELTADRRTGRPLTEQEGVELVREVMPRAMREVGLITRPDDRGAVLLMLCPPLIADAAVLDELLAGVDAVMDAAGAYLAGTARRGLTPHGLAGFAADHPVTRGPSRRRLQTDTTGPQMAGKGAR
ncbi:MAG TPA: aspartate aminotransferase family protein [Ornithinimicrobium sp.]|uniref:aspartate aminotransferase family protein n=1 Tax=Ornithinimicrobium sp. TaxID=1977084 RepID=UPI002B4931A2|nr:aspartate aminotransferase family protein [Ornithinimicrobium sp.]HKJ11011.1 aspartate aminotransferase family protein [Ornithinimicrobium sp.]